jgi:hypothetical protein
MDCCASRRLLNAPSHQESRAADIRALSPLKWQHVNQYGTFTLNMQERLPRSGMVLSS